MMMRVEAPSEDPPVLLPPEEDPVEGVPVEVAASAPEVPLGNEVAVAVQLDSGAKGQAESKQID